jgi:hypothetical protein
MDPIFVEGLTDHILVTLRTQLRTLFFCFNRIWRSGWQMAFRAFIFGHGGVYLVIENAPGIGTVGTMAGITVGVCYGVVQVFAVKRRLVGFMAILAESRHALFQQIVGPDRSVGIMAADAPLAGHHGLMLKAQLPGFFIDILVTVKTDLILRFLKHRPVIRGMRIVAF